MRCFLVFGLVLSCAAGIARAADYEITSETTGQGYQLRAADNTLVNRRRLTQYLGLDVFNIGPKDDVGRPLDRNQFYVTTAMRFDSELGNYADYTTPPGRSPEPYLDAARFELLYAYAGVRNLGGFVDIRLGRQIQVELFDFISYDGLSVEFKTPFNLALEAWGGLNVSGASPVDSPVYRTDGVSLGGNPLGSLLQRQEDALEPTFGFALKTIGLRFLDVRLSYLRTMSFTQDQQPGEPGSGVLNETVGLTARGRLFHGLLVPWFGFRYQILTGRLDEIQGGLRFLLPRQNGLQLEYVYSAPTFDGDSIWNVFASEPFNDVRLSWDATFHSRLRTYARGFVRLFRDETTSPITNFAGQTVAGQINPNSVAGLSGTLAYGASAGFRYDLPRGHVRVDGYYSDGYGGLEVGADASGRVRIVGDVQTGLFAEGRLSYVHFRDDSRPIDHADSFGIQAGLRYGFLRGLIGHLLMEENVNRIYASQFRLIGVLEVAYWLGPHGRGFTPQRVGAF
jgi:hypothetical protein